MVGSSAGFSRVRGGAGEGPGKSGGIWLWHPHCFQTGPRMDVSLYQAASGMNASTRWQEVIAENLGASQVPGFKRQDISFSAVQAGFMPRARGVQPGPAQRYQMPLAAASINFQPGELRPTGVSTDLAIEGAGFFEVRTPNGTRAYTRDGEFHLDSQGQLVNKQGLAVMSETGPLQADPQNTSPLNVAANGEVSQGGQSLGRIKVAGFNDLRVLVPAGAGCFVLADPAIQPSTSTTATLHQGFLESSNASSVLEMGNLISAMRLYEANQKVAQMEDDRLSKLIGNATNTS